MTINIPREFFLNRFLDFMAENPVQHQGDCTLADYIHSFVWDRLGAVSCFGDFGIFLKGVALVVDAWHRDPTILDFPGNAERNLEPFERRPTSAFGDGDALHEIFDKDDFTAAIFNWQHLDP